MYYHLKLELGYGQRIGVKNNNRHILKTFIAIFKKEMSFSKIQNLL